MVNSFDNYVKEDKKRKRMKIKKRMKETIKKK